MAENKEKSPHFFPISLITMLVNLNLLIFKGNKSIQIIF